MRRELTNEVLWKKCVMLVVGYIVVYGIGKLADKYWIYR
jgi:hypothetical protein